MSFTFDMWTSDAGDPYISITGHYVDAPTDKPQDWELRLEQLAFKHVEGRHNGKNIANVLIGIIDHYGLHGKVSKLITLRTFLIIIL